MPLAGHDEQCQNPLETRRISIHVPLAGHDVIWRTKILLSLHFNPRAPYGARHSDMMAMALVSEFQSTCPLRGTTAAALAPHGATAISIHVPLAGHDTCSMWTRRELFRISIHVPLAGHDKLHSTAISVSPLFQSTCPLRGTTKLINQHKLRRKHFNPRAPCGARRRRQRKMDYEQIFQSTCPLRGTTFVG